MKLLIVAALAAVLGFLESRVVDAPVLLQLGSGILIGGLWAAAGALVTRRLRRTRRRTAGGAVAVAIASAMLLAPGIILHLMFADPGRYLGVQQSPAGTGTVAYYALLNPLTEWVLVPLTLWLAWPDRRTRVPALAAAVLYYLERAATYLYFAPEILGWQRPGAAPSLDGVAVWMRLDAGRMVVNGVAIALFTLAALRTVAEPDEYRGAMPVPA